MRGTSYLLINFSLDSSSTYSFSRSIVQPTREFSSVFSPQSTSPLVFIISRTFLILFGIG